MGVISPLLSSKQRRATLQTKFTASETCRRISSSQAVALMGAWTHTAARVPAALVCETGHQRGAQYGPSEAWVCVWVKGTGWISQMQRALWHDLQQGKKSQLWLSYKQPQIPLTSAGAVPPFCRVEFDFESLGVQC